MISHRHQCLFTHVPKTGGKSVLSTFGLPLLGREYDSSMPYIEEPYCHRPLWRYQSRAEFSYFKFSFVRNPWERLVSAFFYLNAGGCSEGDQRFRADQLVRYGGIFDAFVRDLPRLLEAKHFRPQTDWLCDETGRLLPDFVGRFEMIEQDFAVVADRLSIPSRLPVMNRSVHRPYREMYDSVTRAMVAQAYRRDIEVLGYEF